MAMANIRILAVDDNSVGLKLIVALFRNEPSFEVVTCDTGKEVLSRLNSGEKFDVLLADWMMPEMSGYQLVCLVRANVHFSNLRIMMLTAKTEMEDVQQALSAGADEYLMKPFTKEMLLKKLALLGFS